MSFLALVAETTVHGDDSHGEHGEAVFPPFNPEYWESQIFWLIVSFAALYLVLSRFILPKFANTIERRGSRIAADLDEAARLNDEAAEAQQALELSMAKARAEARETAAEAQATAQAQMSAKTAEADTEIEAKLTEAETTISAMRASAMEKVEDIASEAAQAMATRLGTSVSASEAQKAVKAALAS